MPVLTATDYVTLPAGEYRAKVKKAEQASAAYGEIIKVFFEILDDPEYAGDVVSGIATATFSPKSKLRAWAEALTGRQFQPGDPFDTDDLAGRLCRLTLIEHETPDGIFNRVAAVLPPERTRRQPAPAGRQAPRRTPDPQPEPFGDDDGYDPEFVDDAKDTAALAALAAARNQRNAQPARQAATRQAPRRQPNTDPTDPPF